MRMLVLEPISWCSIGARGHGNSEANETCRVTTPFQISFFAGVDLFSFVPLMQLKDATSVSAPRVADVPQAALGGLRIHRRINRPVHAFLEDVVSAVHASELMHVSLTCLRAPSSRSVARRGSTSSRLSTEPRWQPSVQHGRRLTSLRVLEVLHEGSADASALPATKALVENCISLRSLSLVTACHGAFSSRQLIDMLRGGGARLHYLSIYAVDGTDMRIDAERGLVCLQP